MSSAIPLGQMLDMLESKTGNPVSALKEKDEGILPSGGLEARRMAQSAATALYTRSVPTVAGGVLPPSRTMGMGRIQEGTSALLGSVGMGSFFSYQSCQTANQLKVSGAMIHAFGRTTTDPFYEAMKGFTKKAKKACKKI